MWIIWQMKEISYLVINMQDLKVGPLCSNQSLFFKSVVQTPGKMKSVTFLLTQIAEWGTGFENRVCISLWYSLQHIWRNIRFLKSFTSSLHECYSKCNMPTKLRPISSTRRLPSELSCLAGTAAVACRVNSLSRDRNCPHIPCNRFLPSWLGKAGWKPHLYACFNFDYMYKYKLKKTSNNIKMILMNVFKV
jgi:hypothetical protein